MRTAIIVAQLADLLTFLMAASVYGISGEANVLMGWLYVNLGWWAVVLLKVIAAVGYASWVGSRHGAVRALGIIAGIGLGLLGAAVNTWAVTVR